MGRTIVGKHAAALCLLFAAGARATPTSIMCVGDSITIGFTDSPTWTVPYEEGYRGDLYQSLTQAGYTFNYVGPGTNVEPWNAPTDADNLTVPNNIPAFDLRSVNQDNFGAVAGEDSYYLAQSQNFPAWLTQYKPNIVLLDSSINDIYEGATGFPQTAATGLQMLVQDFVNEDPTGHLIVAQITPYAGYTESIVEFNNWIASDLVPYYANAGYGVSTVNLYNLMLVNGQTSASVYANGLNHPDNAHYALIANQWLAGIESVIAPPTTASDPRIITAPVMGALDLQETGAIVQDVSLATITSEIAAGYDGGTWAGAGITSTAARFDTTGLTALGVISNNNGSGAIYQTFEGVAVTADELLIKYTYYGDANLDGRVDGSDYSIVDYAYGYNQSNPDSPLTGWANGDFNYDGQVDGSDYTLMDNAFNQQGAQLTDAVTTELAAGPSPVPEPEPGTTGIFAVAAAACLRRRRRQHGLLI